MNRQRLLSRITILLVLAIYCGVSLCNTGIASAAVDCTDPTNCTDAEDLYSVNYNSAWYDPRDQNACGAQQATTASAVSTTDSTEQQIASNFVLGFDAGVDKNIIKDLVGKYHIGGMYLTGTTDAVKAGFDKAFYDSLNSAAGKNLVIASDEEGVVTRYDYSGTAFPSAKSLAQLHDPGKVQAKGKEVGTAMAANGITVDLAPVLDLRDVGDGLVGRSFSSNPATVAETAGAFATGLKESGLTPVFKHFPGFDSSTSGTTDTSKVTMTGSIDKTVQPYKTLLAKFPDAGVMLSNLYVNKLDKQNPSSLSPATVDYLRKDLNFDGMITTDDLAVKSVTTASGSLSKAVADSLAAGVTMPLFGFSAVSRVDADKKITDIINTVKSNKAAKARAIDNIDKIKAYQGGNSSAQTTASTTPTQTGTTQKTTVSGPTIVIDPGHSGKTISDIDPETGILDKDYANIPEIDDVFNIATIVKAKLEVDGYTVIMTKQSARDSLSQRGRAEVANNANAALAISIHDDTSIQFGKGNSKVYPQKVGLYRESQSGKKITFTDEKVAALSQKYAAIFQQQRSKAQGDDVAVEAPVTTINGRGLAPGNIWMPQLFSKVPWVYNEVGGHSAGKSKLSNSDKQKYADGLIQSIEQAVPTSSIAATQATDTDDVGGCCTTASNSSVSLSGDGNRAKIWQFLKSKGLTDQQAAGVMGNIDAESGFNPARNQEGYALGAKAWGLAQWDGGRRDKLVGKIKATPALAPLYDLKYGGRTDAKDGYVPKDMKIEDNDALLQFELNFLYQESNARTVSASVAAQGFGKAGTSEWETLKKQTTVEDAAVYWHNNFEVSSDTKAEVIKNRGGAAKDAFKDFANTAATGAEVTGTACVSTAISTGNTSGFSARVLAYAWPKYLGTPYTKMKPDYAKAIKTAQKAGRYVGSPAGIDCGGFVTTLLIDSGYEPRYNYAGKSGAGNTITQRAWMRKHWKKIGTGSTIKAEQLQPGDVAVSDVHTFVYVGKIPGFQSTVASASQGDRAPMAGGDKITESAMEWFHKP